VDGTGPARKIGEQLAERHGVRLLHSEQNRGKLSALRLGALRLLGEGRYDYIGAVDQDGDHFANELLNFIRASEHVRALTGSERVLVLGRRQSRHHPLGFQRGELEALADQVLLDALHYDAARGVEPLDLRFTSPIDPCPDFHSGYKVFSRKAAEETFGPEPDTAGLPEDACYRHAVEAVLCVEALKTGALLVEINRSTIDEQPVSVFADFDRTRLVADKILWPCRRLDIPARYVARWIDNHLPSLLLRTLSPEGKKECLDIRRRVFQGMGMETGTETNAILRPPFL